GSEVMHCRGRAVATKQWVIECRSKWFNDPWGEWKFERGGSKDPYKFDYEWAYDMLQYHKERHDHPGPGNIQFEYRVKLI
ncbi:unnamed protein product, partial [marine sediment metagenome]